MDRLGALEPTTLTGESKQLYEDIRDYFEGNVNYTYRLNNGQMVGPFGIELHTPGAGYAWLKMTKSLAEITELPPLAREVAILVTGNHEAAAYELYAHSAVSRLSSEDLKTIADGRCPDHLDEKCHAAFDLATDLCKPGRLSDKAWEKAIGSLGRMAAVAVVHYVGFYKYVATILNGFDAKVPEGSSL